MACGMNLLKPQESRLTQAAPNRAHIARVFPAPLANCPIEKVSPPLDHLFTLFLATLRDCKQWPLYSTSDEQVAARICASSKPFSCRIVDAKPRKPWPIMRPL